MRKAQAVGEHAGDRAGAVPELQRLAVGALRGGRDAQVALRRQPHADEADTPGEQGADQKRAGSAEPEGALAAGVGDREQHRDNADERPDLAELRGEVGVCAFTHGSRDLLHARSAPIGAHHLANQHPGVEQASDRDHEHCEQRDDLDLRVRRI
jgi:hypothetical protein